MGEISSEATQIRYPDDIKGIFATVLTPYNDVCDFVSKLCHTGDSEMAKIADALRISHRVYQETEQEITRQINQLGL